VGQMASSGNVALIATFSSYIWYCHYGC